MSPKSQKGFFLFSEFYSSREYCLLSDQKNSEKHSEIFN